MALNEFKQGTVIHSEGDPIGHLSLITSGEFETTFHGHTILFEKADVIGLCDLLADGHSHTYTAVSDANAYQYPYEDFSSLEALIRGNSDIAYAMVNSTCRQVKEYMQYMHKLKHEAESAHELATELYPKYERLCKQFAYTPKKLPGLSEIAHVSESALMDDWVCDYYVEICDLDPGTRKRFFFDHQGISIGFIRRCAEDMVMARQACTAYLEYVGNISKLFLNDEKHDLFSIISDLHINSTNIKGADAAIEELIEPLLGLLSEMSGIDQEDFQNRLDSYGEILASKRENQEVTDAPQSTGVSQNLLESLQTILKYSGCEDDVSNQFARDVQDYTELTDRISSDDDVYDLRKRLTRTFYDLYKLIFVKTLDDPDPPTVIKMFLNFGYVDPTLAGYDNAEYLFSIADSIKGYPEKGIYTICEWLSAIYYGDVEPSLSEFEMDYTTYLRDLRQSNSIDANEEARLLNDQKAKLFFEMDNAFPVVNRVTFGNPTKFCPLFADHNIVRGLENILVTAEDIKKYLDDIRKIDFSAYYRETSYQNPKLGVPNELVNVEVLPNIIMMPNLGLRGSMWQEIEGRKRTTPARMFLPIFLEGDLKALVIRLTGEFRWEMCKRVQGSRWNDLSDPSLTSIFCDYLQFYMNNRNLSMQTMLAIRNEVSSARNNYKTVFVSNYSVWILNESTGSARLNNVAITILMTFCPFAEHIREYLANNLRYNEALTRFRAKQTKRVQHMTRVVQKVKQTGKPVPDELLDELEYSKR